jgi:hypothetical protein
VTLKTHQTNIDIFHVLQNNPHGLLQITYASSPRGCGLKHAAGGVKNEEKIRAGNLAAAGHIGRVEIDFNIIGATDIATDHEREA